MDEEDLDNVKKDLAKVSAVGTQIMELTGQLCEIFKDDALAVVRDNAQTFFATQLQKTNELTEEELLDALCFFCDFVLNTSINKDSAMLAQLTAKYIEVAESSVCEN